MKTLYVNPAVPLKKSGIIIMFCGFLLLFSSIQNVFQLQKKFYLPHEMWSGRG